MQHWWAPQGRALRSAPPVSQRSPLDTDTAFLPLASPRIQPKFIARPPWPISLSPPCLPSFLSGLGGAGGGGHLSEFRLVGGSRPGIARPKSPERVASVGGGGNATQTPLDPYRLNPPQHPNASPQTLDLEPLL